MNIKMDKNSRKLLKKAAISKGNLKMNIEKINMSKD